MVLGGGVCGCETKSASKLLTATRLLNLFAARMFKFYLFFIIISAVVAFNVRTTRTAQSFLSMAERTYIMIKPDGVQRRVVGQIIQRFEDKGYELKALKLTTPPRSLLEEHYKDLAAKPFFPKLMGYMSR